MTREDKEYLNSKIAAYGKAHPNGNKEDLELLDEMRGHNLISKKEAMLMTALAVKAKEKEIIDKVDTIIRNLDLRKCMVGGCVVTDQIAILVRKAMEE